MQKNNIMSSKRYCALKKLQNSRHRRLKTKYKNSFVSGLNRNPLAGVQKIISVLERIKMQSLRIPKGK